MSWVPVGREPVGVSTVDVVVLVPVVEGGSVVSAGSGVPVCVCVCTHVREESEGIKYMQQNYYAIHELILMYLTKA